MVVTGQQPGFLGGPLYTLHKIATAIALARRRTPAGRPTVPVFWSGDDDDDLAEALAPVAWDAATGALKGPRPLPGLAGQRTTVGSLRVGSADWPDPAGPLAGSDASPARTTIWCWRRIWRDLRAAARARRLDLVPSFSGGPAADVHRHRFDDRLGQLHRTP